VLIVAPFPPGGVPAHGGGNAIAQIVKSLARRNRVALAYLRAQDESEADASLAVHCDAIFESRRPGTSESSIRPLRRLPMLLPKVMTGHPLWVASRWSPAFARLLRRVAESWKPEIVQAEFGAMGVYLPAATRGGARTVVTFHDPEAPAAAERSARSSGAERVMWTFEAMQWRIFGARILGSIDAAVAFTDRDARALAAMREGSSITTVPLGVEMPPSVDDTREPSPPLLLFVGNFNHPPNVDAARVLLDEVYPRLRASHANLEVALVGAGPPEWIRARAGHGIRVTGFVPDLAAMLRAATVFIAPLRHGGGMRLKVLDALASGKATVGTSLAFEGTGVEQDRHALIADDTDAMCAAVDRLLRDPDKRVTLGRAARAHAAATLSWDRTAALYEEVYERVLSRHSARATSRPGDDTPVERGPVKVGHR
jgi:glycosyltransferase involved in cell wall biosynthesis